MSIDKRPGTVQSLRHGLQILRAVAAEDQPVGITEISRTIGLAKSSISRLVATLVEEGFLAREAETGRYRLSTGVWHLGMRAISGLDIRDISRPILRRVHDETQETVHVTIMSDDFQMIFLDKTDSTKAVLPNVQIGAPHPAYCSANGKCILAFMPDETLEALFAKELAQHTSSTITTLAEFRPHLESIRRRGYAINNGEYREDVSGVAAPIFDHAGRVVAALGISIPTSRRSAELVADLTPRVARGAKEISILLGSAAAEDLGRHPSPGLAAAVSPESTLPPADADGEPKQRTNLHRGGRKVSVPKETASPGPHKRRKASVT